MSEIPNGEGSNLVRHAYGYSYYILRSDSMKNKPKETVATVTAPSYFSRKIGNTIYVVSVSFSEKATDSIDDKILKLVANDIQNGAMQKCS